MFKEFFENRRIIKAAKEWNKSPIGQALAQHTHKYFYDEAILSHFDEENKNRIVDDFYQKVFTLSQADNAFLEMRELVASYVCGYATYQVLCLKESEKKEAFYSDCPYISGELYKYIGIYTEHNDELGELKWKFDEISDDDLISFCNSRCALHLYYVNGMNLVRGEFDDVDNEKDWLRPFIKSMLIWEEDQVRKKLNLSSLLTDPLDGLKHSTFMNLVTNGHKNPYYEWEKSWSEDEIV
jgi:hypothetical protein